VGQGCPDLLVDFRRKTMLMEIKDGELPPSKRMLTDDERQFFTWWTGPAYVVKSVAEALEVLNGTNVRD